MNTYTQMVQGQVLRAFTVTVGAVMGLLVGSFLAFCFFGTILEILR